MKDSHLYSHRSDLNDAAMERAEQQVRHRIEDTLEKIERDIGMDHIDPNDAQLLRYAAQEIRDAAPRVLSTIAVLKEEEHQHFRSFLRGLDDLTRGLVIAANYLAATKSGENFFGIRERAKATKPSREARQVKRSSRDEILDQHIGRLIEKGLGGESLRSALRALFKNGSIAEKLPDPSPSTVHNWKRNYKRNGDWRTPPKAG